jgi:5-methylcytosine-specific restriction endonuclease McrA
VETADPQPKEESGAVFFELRACLDEAAKADLDTVQNLLRHRLPQGNLNDVLKLVLREAAERLLAKKACALKKVSSRKDKSEPTQQPTAQPPQQDKARTRPIPRAVRRMVYARDEGKCTWKSASGQVCGATAFLEYNHKKAFTLGGLHTVDNINLLCRAHNQLDGVAVFGETACSPRRTPPAQVGRRRTR